jgi:hypothetical protein
MYTILTVGLVSLAVIVTLAVFFTTWKVIGKMYEWEEEELGDGIDKRKRASGGRA